MVVFPVPEDKKVIAVRQFRYGANCFVLEIPGDCPKEGQSAENTLKAELLSKISFEVREIMKIAGGCATGCVFCAA